MQHPGLSLFVPRLLFICASTVALLTLASVLITVLGSHTVLASTDSQPTNSNTMNLNDPNLITDAGSAMLGNVQNAMISAGRKLYTNSQYVTSAINRSGSTIGHGSAVLARNTAGGVAFVGKSLGNAILFNIRLPGKVASSINYKHSLKSIVQPADNSHVPIISNQTSAAMLAHYNAQQQQEIAKLLAAQIDANEHLGGSIVAGDPNHGGYPTKWANASQDSKLDSWGMYNRECVSYVAWKVYQTFGYMPYWGGVGNASQWIGDAKAAKIPTGSMPRVHSVAISMRGYYGHAMWVEAVKGNMIYVSQYNYDLRGHYSEMWVNSSSFTYLYFK